MSNVADGERAQYRTLIDSLVLACREGQGRIGPDRARRGVWNPVAAAQPGEMPGQHEMNILLAGLSDSGREVLARMLAEAFRSGVHETLVILHAATVPPFQDGYEGSPYHDFAGRLEGWPWPAG
jgi:hypothetical protein